MRRRIYIDCGANEGLISWKFIIAGHDDFEYFLFEPLPVLSDVGDRMQRQFPNTKINFSNSAVWIKDEELNFYLSTRGQEGSSVCENKFSNFMNHDEPLRVNGIDFGKWIKENFSKDDYIICKMDIEGAEYDVVPHMIDDGSIEYMDEMIIEFHTKKQISGDYIHGRYQQIKEYFENTNTQRLIEWW